MTGAPVSGLRSVMTRAPLDSDAGSATAGADGGWVDRLKVCAFLTVYVTGLWGQAARVLPAPFNDWHGVPYRLVAPWWHENVFPQLSREEQVALFQVLAAYLLALALPILALRCLGISARSAGLRKPLALGLPITTAGVLLTLPVGFWLTAVSSDPWGSPIQEALEFLALVPEHFLVFGIFGVLLLPERRLAWPPPAARQTSAGLFTVMAAGIVFVLIHVGTPHSAELWASFPLGVLFAVMTFVTGSIWPAVIAHVTLNIFPMAILPTG
jgi:membrane protease YdiL (CAAX protease family)